MKHGLLKLKCHEHTSDHSIYKVTSLLYLLSFAICQTLKGIWGILSGPQSALIPSKELSVGELRIYWKEYWKIGTGSFKTANCNLSKLAAWEHNYPKRQFSVDINFVLLAAAHLLSSRPTNQPIQPNTFHKYYHLSLRNYCGRYYLFIALFQATSVGFTHPSFLPASQPSCLPALSLWLQRKFNWQLFWLDSTTTAAVSKQVKSWHGDEVMKSSLRCILCVPLSYLEGVFPKMGFHQHQWTFQGQVGLGGPCLSPLWPDINHKPTFTCTLFHLSPSYDYVPSLSSPPSTIDQ